MAAREDAVRTIVHYTTAEAPFNGYPRRIVSPPLAGSCCLDQMESVGHIHQDDELPYIYRRCKVCGHTVRQFIEGAVRRLREY